MWSCHPNGDHAYETLVHSGLVCLVEAFLRVQLAHVCSLGCLWHRRGDISRMQQIGPAGAVTIMEPHMLLLDC